ncbi:mucin-5AC-like protein [Arabidopsis thaliana]|uniref:Mucin-5AC-like protein n=1 Tax=Arabidopsis thaliana TaxID=3702 RepID=A0A1I9LNE4_ARATH|nr:mucin-5AC-like protein [Arabidopsis thaliana]ANM64102.1 mucin-5AC-like protein [Arabidopsis thaliana]|eukprot:NP_001326152.1 mucin-5AC-like protein [Arabidopsis thaliana]
MSDRSLKKSLPGKSNRQADENLDLFSVNRGTSLDGRHSFQQAKVAKHGPDDDNNHNIHANEPLYTIAEVPLGDLSRLVLEARNTTSKLQSITTTRVPLRSESDPSSRPTRSGSTIRPSNIPTIRSSSVPKKTTTTQIQASASVSSPKRTVSRSLTPSSRKTPSPTSTPSRISTTTSTTPSFKTAGDAQRSRSLTPRAKPQIAANASSRTNVRSSSVTSRPDRSTTVSATPRTPPRLKETVTLAFGRPVGHVNSPKRNTSPDVTRTRPKGRSASPSLIPTFSGTSHTTTTPKSIKPSATVADSTRPGRKLSRASVQMAINHLDLARNGKVSTHTFSSPMLYPHSIRSSSSGLRKPCGSSEGSCSSSNHEEEDGRSLTKEGNNTENKNDSARYDALLNVKDVKDTNWLLNIDDESPQSLIFDNAFDSPPDLFSPL